MPLMSSVNLFSFCPSFSQTIRIVMPSPCFHDCPSFLDPVSIWKQAGSGWRDIPRSSFCPLCQCCCCLATSWDTKGFPKAWGLVSHYWEIIPQFCFSVAPLFSHILVYTHTLWPFTWFEQSDEIWCINCSPNSFYWKTRTKNDESPRSWQAFLQKS